MLTSSLIEKLLKEWYTKDKLESMLFKQFPALEKLPKEKAGGRYFFQPVLNGANVRRSANYSLAVNSISTVSPAVAFQVPYMQDYAVCLIDGKAWEQSTEDAGAFMNVFRMASDQSIAALRKSLALKIYRNGTGSVARLGGSSTAATVQALATREDQFNFEIGDVVQFSSGDGGTLRAGLPANTYGATIVGIQDNGTTASLVFSTALNASVTDVGATDFIYLNSGDAQNNSATPAVVTGFLAYSPASTASLTVAFHGVTRSQDERRLRGQYIAQPGSAPVDEQIQKGITALVALGGMPDAVFMNPSDVLDLQKVAASKVMRQAGGEAKLGFKSYTFATAGGDITVYSDPACPKGFAFVADLTGLKIAHLGEPIGIRKAGDSTTVRSATSQDAWQIDWRSYCNLVAERPGQVLATVQL